MDRQAEWLIGRLDFTRGRNDSLGDLPTDRAGIEQLAAAVRSRLDPETCLIEYAWSAGSLVAVVLDHQDATAHELGLTREDAIKLVSAVAEEIDAAVDQ